MPKISEITKGMSSEASNNGPNTKVWPSLPALIPPNKAAEINCNSVFKMLKNSIE